MKSIGIVGGGISGLSLAFWLIHDHSISGNNIVIFESSHRVGGSIETFFSSEGQIYEKGPRSIRASGDIRASMEKMLSVLSLSCEMIFPQKISSKRYCLLNGVSAEIPSSLCALFTKPIGRRLLRYLLLEPFTSFRREPQKEGESLLSWIERFCPNDSVMRSIIGAYTSGIWAADADHVSASIAFPNLCKLEQKNRSLVQGLALQSLKSWWDLSGQKKSKKEDRGSIFSFKNGVEELPKALYRWLLSKGVTIQCQSKIENVIFEEKSWRLFCATSKQIESNFSCENLIFAVDPQRLPETVQKTLYEKEWYEEESSRKFSFQSELICRSSVVSVCCGWKKRLQLAQNGFGVLASKEEDSAVLGIVFDSFLFQEIEKTMGTRMTVMIGGTRFPNACTLSDAELIKLARQALRKWIGIVEIPNETFLFRFSKSIAVPSPGKVRLPAYIQNRESSLYMLSAAIGGVAISNCIASSQKLANRLSEC